MGYELVFNEFRGYSRPNNKQQMKIKWSNVALIVIVGTAIWLAATHGHHLSEWWRKAGETPAGPPSIRTLILLAALLLGALAVRRLLEHGSTH